MHSIREEALPLAHDNGMDQQSQLIHQAGFKNYDDFVKAAVPRQAPRGLWGFLRNVLRAISPIRPPAGLPPGRPPKLFINPVTMDLIQMRQIEVDALDRRMNSLNVEVQKKFSIPAACVVFVLVGAPIGMRVRRAGPAVAFVSMGFFLFYYVCLIGGEELANRLLVPPWFAMWIANLVLGGAGVDLTARACDIRLPWHHRGRRGRPDAVPEGSR